MRVLSVILLVAAVATAIPTHVPQPKESLNFVGYLGTEAVELYKSHVRIINGYEVIRGEHPWQMALLVSIVDQIGTGLCGASLLSETRAVTAAHCWNDGVNQGEYIQAIFGGHNLNIYDEHSVRLNTNDVVVHPNWNPFLIRNDVAIVKFPAIEFTQYIRPVALPRGDDVNRDYTGEIGYASGWGITSNDGVAASPVLLGVSMRIISNQVCSLTSLFLVTEDNLCTSGLAGGNVCHGDSGGPLVVFDDSNTPTLVGITSFRHILGCESIMPSMFARVTSFLDFILSEL